MQSTLEISIAYLEGRIRGLIFRAKELNIEQAHLIAQARFSNDVLRTLLQKKDAD